ncbi:hypothetical protein FDA95_06480 [Clostridium botulinum]|nr:hypothetical protein [Clostridium botulinum]NFK78246.1 hypothetical protein [Clostridium botulinum]
MEFNNTLKNDDYITLPRIRKFCKENNLGNVEFKISGIKKIESFGSSSVENECKVNEWLDVIVKEGIKYSYIRKIKENEKSKMFSSEVYWKEFIKKKFQHKEMKHVNEAKFNNKLEIHNLKLYKEQHIVRKVTFNLGILVYEIKNNKNESPSLNKIIYPIFVDLNVSKNIFEIRLKSKSKIYIIKSDKGDTTERLGEKVTTDKMACKVIEFLRNELVFDLEDFNISKNLFFSSYYELLNSLTDTPVAILGKIDTKREVADYFAKNIFSKLNLNNNYINMAKEDLYIWLEKFISLSEPDKDIFIKDKDGYPIKLIATDSDDTKVEETSADMEPLQTKPSFFDHKKILQREKLCDGMSLAFSREETLYYGEKPFLAIIFYKNGFGVTNFPQYVEEGDIQNVLSRIIKNI